MASKINFFTEDIKYHLKDKTIIKKWLIDVAADEGYRVGEASIILCSDAYLSTLNVQYLKHKSLTDIITFDYTEGQLILGDIFISVERVRENAVKYKTPFEEELRRVMAHGILHLCGYKDVNETEQQKMREKEDEKLSKYNTINSL